MRVEGWGKIGREMGKTGDQMGSKLMDIGTYRSAR